MREIHTRPLVPHRAKCSVTDDVRLFGCVESCHALALGTLKDALAVGGNCHRLRHGVCDLREAVPVEAFHVSVLQRKRAAPKDGPCVPVCVAAAYDSFAM